MTNDPIWVLCAISAIVASAIWLRLGSEFAHAQPGGVSNGLFAFAALFFSAVLVAVSVYSILMVGGN